jgi:hypothetical protein
VLKQAVEILKERGRFHPAAGHQKTIAEIYESDIIDMQQAMLNYEEAAELYSGEDAGGFVLECRRIALTTVWQINAGSRWRHLPHSWSNTTRLLKSLNKSPSRRSTTI